jgi:hypothetical protein
MLPTGEGNRRLEALMGEAGFSNSGLSRRLIEAAKRTGREARPSPTQVSRWLKGQEPRADAAALLRQVFSQRLGRPVASDDLGFSSALGSEQDGGAPNGLGSIAALWQADASGDERLGRMPFATASLDRPAMDWMLNASPTLSASNGSGLVVTEADVQVAESTLVMFRSLDHAHGAGHFRSHVVNYLAAEMTQLLSRPTASPRVSQALMRVAAGMSELAGYQAVDVGANGLALRHYLAGLTFAQAAGDRPYGAHLLAGYIAHLSLHVGQPEGALRMAVVAQRGNALDASPAARAAFAAVEARVHARLQDEAACTSALQRAEEELERSDSAQEPEWISYFSPADLEDEMAHCLFDLGHQAQTQRYVRAAVADLPATRVRRLAIDTALLATSLARSGEVDEACAVGREAVDYAARTNSFRSVLRVRDLLAALTPFDPNPHVTELRDYVRTVLPRAV